MREYTHSQAKKTIYLFLSLLLGMFVFFILHRLVIFFIMWFLLSSGEAFVVASRYRNFLVWDYGTLFLSLIVGSWYGLWVGGYWYEKVYEIGLHGGVLGHLAVSLNRFTHRQSSLRNKVEKISQELKEESWQLDDLAKMVSKTNLSTKPVRKRVTTKRVASKKI